MCLQHMQPHPIPAAADATAQPGHKLLNRFTHYHHSAQRPTMSTYIEPTMDMNSVAAHHQSMPLRFGMPPSAIIPNNTAHLPVACLGLDHQPGGWADTSSSCTPGTPEARARCLPTSRLPSESPSACSSTLLPTPSPIPCSTACRPPELATPESPSSHSKEPFRSYLPSRDLLPAQLNNASSPNACSYFRDHRACRSKRPISPRPP